MENIILPKIVSVGIYNTSLAVKNRTVTKNRKTTMFELELPICDGGVSYIDDIANPIRTSTVIVAKPAQTRHTRLPFTCYYIHAIVEKGALYEELMSLSSFIEIPDIEPVRELFARICNIYDDGVEENELLIHSLILQLIHTLKKHSRTGGSRGNSKSNHTVIAGTIDYINANLSSELTLEMLSARSNFTPTYFHKLFKASTGRTLRDYIEEVRIKKAISLMISTSMTLTEISYECGFSSQSYFSYVFKRKMKCPPRKYAGLMIEKYER